MSPSIPIICGCIGVGSPWMPYDSKPANFNGLWTTFTLLTAFKFKSVELLNSGIPVLTELILPGI